MTIKEHLKIEKRLIGVWYSLSHRYFYAVIIGSIVNAITPFVPIYFSAKLIDGLAMGADVKLLALYAALTVGITAILGIIKAWTDRQQELGEEEAFNTNEWMHAEKAMNLAYSSIEDRDVALLQERVKTETNTGYNIFYLVGTTERFVRSAVRIISSISMTATFFSIGTISVATKVVFILGVIFTVLLRILINAKSSKLLMTFYSECVKYNVILDKFLGYIENYTSGMDIRLYGMEELLSKYGGNAYDEVCDREKATRYKCAGLGLILTLTNYALRLGVYLILVFAAIGGGLSVGSIAKIVSCVMLLLTAISEVVSAVQISLVNDKYAKTFFSYFDIPNDMYKGSLSVEKRDDNEYYVEFKDVSFKYPKAEKYALSHVNLKFKVGEKLAVVGMNGSGKTTFIKLLCRLYDPTEGEILLNGVDIKKYDYDEYMSIFSVVFQDFGLFAFSLGENVATSNRYDENKVKACLKKAGFEERLEKMPQGLDTMLYKDFDKNGVEISGGEAQKIALARALYKDSPFMVLDEPTSALDPVSEYEVYSKFNEISGDKTSVYISHRLASCRFCDKIAVFDNGNIVQIGSHEKLLADKFGKYHELWHAQAKYYVKEESESD